MTVCVGFEMSGSGPVEIRGSESVGNSDGSSISGTCAVDVEGAKGVVCSAGLSEGDLSLTKGPGTGKVVEPVDWEESPDECTAGLEGI